MQSLESSFCRHTELTSQHLSNNAIISLETDQRRERRLLLENLQDYTSAVLAHAQKEESLQNLALQMVLSDIKFSYSDFEKMRNLLYQRSPGYLVEMTVQAERRRLLQQKSRKQPLTEHQAVSYLQQKIEVLKEIEKNGLLKGLKGVSEGQRAQVGLSYVNDRVALYSGLEEKDVISRADFAQNQRIRKLFSKFSSEFQKVFPKE